VVVDPAQKMIGRHVLIEAEIIEELRRSRLKSHHRLIPCQITQRIESCVPSACNNEFFNSICQNPSLQESAAATCQCITAVEYLGHVLKLGQAVGKEPKSAKLRR
jgi:hypothetical protein